MVLGIAIGVVLFIIYEKQRVSAPIDGEIDGFQDISNVNESNQYYGKLLQDDHLQTNENRGAKTCLHKYVDIGHFQGGIKMNKDASALLFCTKDGYLNSHQCPGNTCNTCISYKKDFQTINSETTSKYNTLNKSIEDQKEVFGGLDVPIQNTVLALEDEIERRKRLVDNVKDNIKEAKELEASIKTLKAEKKLYDDAKSYCKTQPNSRFYKNIIARKNDPGANYMDLSVVDHDSVEPTPNQNPYKCWSNHRVQTLHWAPSSEQCINHQKFNNQSPEWVKNATKFEDSNIKMNQSNGKPFTPYGAAISSTKMHHLSCDNFSPNSRSYRDGNKTYVLKEGTAASYEELNGDCAENNIQSFDDTTLDECKQLCNNLHDCKGFSYKESGKKKNCIPKNATCSDQNPLKLGSDYKFYQLTFD